MIHLTLNQISAYLDNELPVASVELVRLHLSSCLECTERFGLIEEQEGALARLLVNDPGDRYFEEFTDRVFGPKRAAPEAVPPPVPRPALAAPSPAPRPALAPRSPAPRRPRRSVRLLLPAAALLVVVSAVAVIAVGPERLHIESWPWRMDPATTAESGAGNDAPGEVGSPSTDSPPAPLPATTIDPATLLERAADRSSVAQRAQTADAYDAAAEAWEAALSALQDDPDELAAGRREVASARFAAWRATPEPARRQAATHAVRAYLLCSPQGPERDRAWAWLAELKR